ncbi:helicase-related protein [Aneurinibacillus thermoaerophilus]|uniref:DEAD/DEAH box helicase n=1 Tax=Aneurinibacillus thermoaerophilus TaxID=143495 RepID=UPI002E25023C|nr:helicase-related protein [Aneurinibacillus thermoaerophilus]MED0763318.1 helicase-related protein [Aneurinibacillus thermoaerophilus]
MKWEDKEKIYKLFQGRALLEEEVYWLFQLLFRDGRRRITEEEMKELLQEWIQSGKVERKPGVERVSEKGEGSSFSLFVSRIWCLIRGEKSEERIRYRCNRCGAEEEHIHIVYCYRCQGECPYCCRCLTMGRSSSCSSYYLFAADERKRNPKGCTEEALFYYPQLTQAQRAAARSMLDFYRQETGMQEFLVWAVCGAGKTEVMFPLLHDVLANGERVLWATPRRDVVLELAPRLRRAFPNHPLSVLYGGAKAQDKWNASRFVLATTHQALRFYRHFDVVILDELDAFPYNQDEMLPFAVNRARTLSGKIIYLTATPRPDYQKRIRKPSYAKDFLPHVKIPVRYHGHPLPEPGIRQESKLNARLSAKKPIFSLLSFLKDIERKGVPAFIFVPAIQQLPQLYEYIMAYNSKWQNKLAVVHAADPEREAKVKALREGRLQILLTTTIMERGVTLPGIQVLVCQADAPIFDEAALVQIAGRAGRSAVAPDGMVIFMAEEVTEAMKASIRQIREMNRLAKKLGYLKATKREERI